MTHNRLNSRIFIFLLVALPMLACSSESLAGATPTPSATETPLPTSTSTPRPTSTPLPTATLEPTPAPVGVPAVNDNFEFTVLGVENRDRIYPGGAYLFTPKPGYLILDVAAHVHNLSGEVVSIPWSEVYIREDNGDSWYPLWGTYQAAESGEILDPFTFGISSNEIDGSAKINFVKDIYLRLVYIVNEKETTTVHFGFYDSPLVEFVIE